MTITIHSRVRRHAIGALALFAATATAAWATPAGAAVPGANGKLAFASSADGISMNLFTINPDGSARTALTTNLDFNRQPAWSPDGRKLAFISARDGTPEIFVINADGTGLTQLTDAEQSSVSPAWSPEGQKIAFVSNREGGNEIWVMKADGSEETRLTDSDGQNIAPAWSPDGRRIVFSRSRDDLYVMAPDGSNQVQITDDPAFEADPDWSPDGERIVFASDRDGAFDFDFDIHAINADGSGQVNLTPDASLDQDPVFSPDGSRIAFMSERDGNRDLFAIGATGGELTRLTSDPAAEIDPAWQSIPPNLPPDCSATTTAPAVLEPPARDQLRLVTLSGATDPDGDPLAFHIDAVTQDEPVIGRADDTSPDAGLTPAGADPNQVLLRAERSPLGNGRVYRIAYTVSDGTASCSGVAKVAVARRPGEAAIDDGNTASFDSFTGEQLP